MCPIVPMFTCGLLRSNFSFAISSSAPQSKSCKESVLLELLPAAGLLYNLFREIRGKLRVMRKMHGEIAAALRAAAQIGGVTEHLGERHLHANYVAARTALRALNLRAAGVEVAKHGGHVFFRNDDFHFHNGLEQHRLGSAASFFEAHRTGDLERHFRAVYVVVAA